MSYQKRSSLTIALAVWKALFLREVLTRISARRAGWVWILFEPIVHVIIIMVLWSVVRVKSVAGIDGGIFVMIGVLGFMMAQKTTTKGSHAISANGNLFTYRQILPVDTVLARCMVEGSILLFTSVVILALMALFGFPVIPEHPLQVLFTMCSLWGLGLGLALVLSALGNLVPEIQRMVEMLFRPLYVSSAILYPLIAIPPPYRGWLLLNPIANGTELLRAGFFHQLPAAPGVSQLYLVSCALVLIFLGLALQLRFSDRLVSE